ncbi:hypothetical protein K8089_09545, partial [Aequorivita sp. F47161]
SSIQGLLSWHEDTKFMLIDHEKRLPFLDSLFCFFGEFPLVLFRLRGWSCHKNYAGRCTAFI